MLRQEVKLFLATLVILFGGAGCTTHQSTDPTQIDFLSGLGYKTGVNGRLEEHLTEMEARSGELKKELKTSKEELEKSLKKAEHYKERLRKTRFKTQKAADEAQRVANELQLKQMKLNDKKQELADLESRIIFLKAQKADSQEKLIGLEMTERHLQETKKEIALLNDVLNNTLYLEAENALKYD